MSATIHDAHRANIWESMKEVATALLLDKNGRLLTYLRDDHPSIPFPNCWDLFGGQVEIGETPEDALVREVQEELGLSLLSYSFFRTYHCITGDASPNIKFVFWARIRERAEDLTLYEGQRHVGIDIGERAQYKFANILANVVEDFVHSDAFVEAMKLNAATTSL